MKPAMCVASQRFKMLCSTVPNARKTYAKSVTANIQNRLIVDIRRTGSVGGVFRRIHSC